MTLPDAEPSGPTRAVLAARLAIGLAQGLALYALARLVEEQTPHPWVAANPKGFGLLVLLATLLPPTVVLGLRHLRVRTLAAWTTAAAGLILLLGGYDLRHYGESSMTPASNGLLASLGVMLFVGGALVAAAEVGARVRPGYVDCFEAAWRTGLQLALAACFVLGFWLIYRVGTELFRGIGVDGPHRLGAHLALLLPATTLLGALGIHLVDAGWRFTLGLRNLLLGLKAWLTPVLAGIAAAFLLSLPFTGLGALQERDPAGVWLLVTAAGLVVLVSAVHGDGQGTPPAVPRFAARLAALLLPALVALAGWALLQQVSERGLTEERVLGLAVLAVLAVHAVGYPLAALRADMRPLEATNLAGALLLLLVLAALNSPLADAARLEVLSQTARLLRGEVSAAEFNFDRLRRLGRDGQRALASLSRYPEPEIARRAEMATLPSYGAALAELSGERVVQRLRPVPHGAVLPTGLAEAMREALPACVVEECLARAVAGAEGEMWLVGPVLPGVYWAMVPAAEVPSGVAGQTVRGGAAQRTGWRLAAVYDAGNRCLDEAPADLLEGEGRPVPRSLPDLAFGDVLLRPAHLTPGCL
ncbi:MAG: hypothetical protein E7K72_00870 [Roseomonas mucosa]|nr:hypothetical protein [Roseomonas mucosa]